ncbi:sodium:solute symporter [candidate division KSB1 bacterium]
MAYVITIIAYLIILLTLGIVLSFRVKGQEGFMVANRQLTAPVLVATLLATWIGSGDVFSVSDLSYNHGFSSLIGSSGGWIGILVVFFIAGRVRRFGQFTVPDILEARYDKWARLLATITTIIAYVTIVSYQFRGGGWVLNIISDGAISNETAVPLVAVFVICYTLLAGMLSLAYIDVINGVIILGGVFFALPFLYHNAGGLVEIAQNVTPREHSFLGNMTWIEAMGYFIPTLLLALGNGNMYQRFFSAKNENEARKSVIGWFIGVILIGIALQSIAVIGSSMFKGLNEIESGRIILLAAHRGVPVFVGCILMASIVAIIISTANSFLLVPATNVMRDVVQRFFLPDIKDRSIVLWSRIVVVILGVCAYSLLSFFPRVLSAAYAAYTVYGAGITPALIATFFWKRATPRAGTISIAAGMIMTVVWEIANKIMGALPLGLPAIYPALVCSLVCLFGISFMEPPPEKEKWKPFIDEK